MRKASVALSRWASLPVRRTRSGPRKSIGIHRCTHSDAGAPALSGCPSLSPTRVLHSRLHELTAALATLPGQHLNLPASARSLETPAAVLLNDSEAIRTTSRHTARCSSPSAPTRPLALPSTPSATLIALYFPTLISIAIISIPVPVYFAIRSLYLPTILSVSLRHRGTTHLYLTQHSVDEEEQLPLPQGGAADRKMQGVG